MTLSRGAPTWFLVEGPDGAGKSTIVKELSHALAYSKRPTVVHTLNYASAKREYVQDRGVLSGPVYEPVMRPGETDRLAWLDPLVELAVSCHARLIFVTADIPTLERRVAERGDDYVTPGHIKSLVKGYDEAVARWRGAGGAMQWVDTTEAFPSAVELELAAALLMRQ